MMTREVILIQRADREEINLLSPSFSRRYVNDKLKFNSKLEDYARKKKNCINIAARQ